MHWLFLLSPDWLFLLVSEWLILPGSNNGLHPLNDPDYPLTEKEKRMHNKKAKELFNKKTEFL